jgi:hypothetical protein
VTPTTTTPLAAAAAAAAAAEAKTLLSASSKAVLERPHLYFRKMVVQVDGPYGAFVDFDK